MTVQTIPLTIQPATEKDIPLIEQLAHKIWHEHYITIISKEQIEYMLNAWYSAKSIEQQMRTGGKFFIVYQEDEAVAYASIQVKDDCNFLNKFYVDVSKHRGGIGTQFFNYLLQQMDATKPVRLQVNRQNYKAVNFYFKNGFTIEKVIDLHVGENFYMNDFIMIRQLGNSAIR